MTHPDLFNYLDISQFLMDYYKWKKSITPRFSISKWAEDLGSISKVTLRFILNKRRKISLSTTQIFMNYFQLSHDYKEYFENLVIYSQTKTATEKQAVGQVLIQLQRKQFKQAILPIENSQVNVFAPVVLTLLTFDDLKKTETDIAALLEVDVHLISSILTDLVQKGIVQKKDDHTYHFPEKTFKIPAGAGLKKFYEYWISRSKEALEMPFETRRFRALKFALTPEEFNELVDKMNDYSVALLSKHQSPYIEGRRLYMFETALFPITKPS